MWKKIFKHILEFIKIHQRKKKHIDKNAEGNKSLIFNWFKKNNWKTLFCWLKEMRWDDISN